MSDPSPEEREKLVPGSMLDQVPKPLPLSTMYESGSRGAGEIFTQSMSDWIPKALPLSPISDQARQECEKLILDLMLDWIQELAKLDFSILVLDQIVELPVGVNFFDPPTTHLMANIEDLTDVL